MELFNVDSFKRENGKVVGVAFQQHKGNMNVRIYQEARVIYNAQEAGMNYKYLATFKNKLGKLQSIQLFAEREGDLSYIKEPDDPVEKEVFHIIPEYVRKPTDFI
ncbi:MAG: hypothetical protein IIA83_02475 [Thaumarchaeota archaeon]|nr:hypothetical protein [Nitrososphaerota archaeon]